VPAAEALDVRLWRRVDKTATCWNWLGYKGRDGYGMIRHGHTMKLTHRVSWELQNGPIPDGLYVLHHCDKPACINPEHLFLGTQKDNVDDCRTKGRYALGESRTLSKLTEADVRQIRQLHSSVSQKELAKHYNVHNSVISLVVNRKIWKHVV
jgi:hypothetical protein